MVMNNGWIKIHRDILSWEWYDDIPVKTLFIHLLLKANHEDSTWHGIEIKRGQLICGTEKLGKACGLSRQQIRTALSKLKSTNEITIKATSKHSLITVVNYDKFQERQPEPQHQDDQPSTNHQPQTRIKELKNLKNPPISPQGEDADKRKPKRICLSDYKEWVAKETQAAEVQEAALGWIEMRITKKNPPTQRAVRQAFQEVRKLTSNADIAAAIFDQSTLRGWAGIFELKE